MTVNQKNPHLLYSSRLLAAIFYRASDQENLAEETDALIIILFKIQPLHLGENEFTEENEIHRLRWHYVYCLIR